MAKFTKEQLIEDLKSSTQNDSGMFEIGEDTICALMSMLTNAAPQLPQPAVAITQHFDTIALDTAKMVMCDVNRRDEFLGGDIQLLSRIQCRIDEACRAAMLQAGNSPVIPDCWCRTCRPVTMNDMRFVVCPECGNKRCPHANDHRNACTGSNEPGQEGSAYPAAPQREVKSALEHGMQRYAGAMQKLSEGDE